MGKKGKRGGGGGSGGGGGGGKSPQDAPQQQQQRQQSQPQTPQGAPDDFPPPGASGAKKGVGKQKQQQGGGRGDGPGPSAGPQQQQQQRPQEDLPPPGGVGEFQSAKKNKRKGRPEQEEGGERYQHQQPQHQQPQHQQLQHQQPQQQQPQQQQQQQHQQQQHHQQQQQYQQHPQRFQQHQTYPQHPQQQQYHQRPPYQQQQRPQHFPQQQRPQSYQQQQQGVRSPWGGPRAGPPGFVTGGRPQEPSFFTPPQQVQQGPPRQVWNQPAQPTRPPVAQPPAWGQRGPTPQQQHPTPTQSRETTPTHQSLPSVTPQKQASPVGEQPPLRQQPIEQPQRQLPTEQPQRPPPTEQPQRPPPTEQQRQPTQTMRKSPPGGNGLPEKMKGLSFGSSIIPKRCSAERPNTPKKGREITVETNHLALNIKNKDMLIHHYDVAVNPEKPYRIYRKALELVQKSCYPKRFPAFDGKKNLYSYPELPFKTSELVETVTVYDAERDQTKEVTVTIKHATTVHVGVIWDYLKAGSSTSSPQDAIQALDIVLRQPAANSFVTVGRSFFTPPPGRVISLGDGLDLWYGFFQSAIIGWKPYLNIDVAHKGFPTPDSCVNAFAKVIHSRDGEHEDSRFKMQYYQEELFLAYIKNLKVIYEIPQRSIKRTYKVTGLTKCPRDNKFEVVDKDSKATTKTTVEKYFQSQYRYPLRYPHLPCLMVGPNDKPLSLPMELCRIAEGQVTMKKMNDIQTRNMVKEAAVDTERRKQKIMKSIEQINFNNDPCLKEFGLSVADRFTKVKARILNAPTVDYRESKPVNVSQGVWRNQKFLQGAELLQWRILNSSRYIREQDVRQLGDGLVSHGRSCGMNISQNYSYVTKENANDIERYFKQCQTEDVKLVIVILPEKGVSYASVKKIAELQVGILTQCLKSVTVKTRLSPPTFVNILQKVNAKLNGINHNITPSFWPSFFQKPVIVVGADVTHPAPDQVNVPSIAAVAASHDPKAFKYNMIWKLQPPREEVIKDLKDIMREQLMMFYRTTKQKPHAILFYRDGVSEGQFKTILDIELSAIRQACSSLQTEYKPPITFLVVQKRHHTRFFPDKKDADGKNRNVPAGTVVDTEITHPTELDFYLVSHASIQGTARPTKYHLLWDDSNMSEQDLEEITYYLCHLFTRCTRSVSYPAPTYYAHLAAFRARSYTETERLQLDQLEQEQTRRQVRDVIIKSNPMYFV